MKFCPTCETRYDEDILRFCMKDGTPLVDENEPKFIQMPSESLGPTPVDDDEGEVTVVRRIKVPPPVSAIDEIEFEPKEDPPPRIVVPMSQPETPRTRVVTAEQRPKKGNTILVVFLTMLGTAALLVIGAGILWLFLGRGNNAANSNANSNLNANANVNINSNLGISNAFDFGNTNTSETNTNTNARTPTPTPTATPRPNLTPTPDETPDGEPSPTPVRTPTPARTPVPMPTPIIIRPGQPVPRTPPPDRPRAIPTPLSR